MQELENIFLPFYFFVVSPAVFIKHSHFYNIRKSYISLSINDMRNNYFTRPFGIELEVKNKNK